MSSHRLVVFTGYYLIDLLAAVTIRNPHPAVCPLATQVLARSPTPTHPGATVGSFAASSLQLCSSGAEKHRSSGKRASTANKTMNTPLAVELMMAHQPACTQPGLAQLQWLPHHQMAAPPPPVSPQQAPARRPLSFSPPHFPLSPPIPTPASTSLASTAPEQAPTKSPPPAPSTQFSLASPSQPKPSLLSLTNHPSPPCPLLTCCCCQSPTRRFAQPVSLPLLLVSRSLARLACLTPPHTPKRPSIVDLLSLPSPLTTTNAEPRPPDISDLPPTTRRRRPKSRRLRR